MQRRERAWTLPVLLLYGAVVLLPALSPFSVLVKSGGGHVWDANLHGPLMVHSLKLAVTVALTTTLAALPLALLLHRTRIPLRRLWSGVLVVPLLVPPYILGVGVLHLLGPRLAVGFTGSALTLFIWLLPLALLFIGAGLRLVARAQEESALLDTSWAGVLRHVTVPMVAPHALAGGLFALVLALGEFGIPVLFQYRVYSGAIFVQFAAFYDFRQAVLTSLPLLGVILPATLLAQRVWRRGERQEGAEGSVAFNLGRAVGVLTLMIVLFASAVLSPLLKIAADVASGPALWVALLRLGPQALYSFACALMGTVATVGVAVLVAWGTTRFWAPWTGIVLAVQLPLFSIPAVIVGLGLIEGWNRPDWRGLIYDSPGILALGYAARFTPLLIPLVASSFQQLPRELDEAARLDGAAPPAILWRVHLPLLRPVLVAASLLAFVLSIGEVPVSLLVAPPGGAPMAVRFFTMITNARKEQVAALSLILTLLAVLPVAAWLALERHSEGQVRRVG